MKRFFLLIFSFVFFNLALFAQELTDHPAEQDGGQQAPPPEAEQPQKPKSDIVYKMNQKGDHYIVLKLNLDVPYRPFKNLKLGGSGTLGYQHFLTSAFSLGGEISFAYSKTIGDNVFYFVPFIFRLSWQFSAGKFEFPLSLGIGGALENYLNRTYFGFIVHPELAAYYRFKSNWSIGLRTGLYIMPQWYKNKEYDYTALIHDIGLAVRYHF